MENYLTNIANAAAIAAATAATTNAAATAAATNSAANTAATNAAANAAATNAVATDNSLQAQIKVLTTQLAALSAASGVGVPANAKPKRKAKI